MLGSLLGKLLPRQHRRALLLQAGKQARRHGPDVARAAGRAYRAAESDHTQDVGARPQHLGQLRAEPVPAGEPLRPEHVGVDRQRLVLVAGALLLGRWLEALAFGVAPSDPRILTASAVVLALVALVAAWLLAQRATRVEPLVAMQGE